MAKEPEEKPVATKKPAAKKSEQRITPKSIFMWGCLAPTGVFLAVIILFILWFALSGGGPAVPPEYIKSAEPQVKKKALQTKSQDARYDLDETVMTIYSIERAMADAKDFKQLTSYILQQDSDRISPDVLALKYRFFDVYKKLLDTQDELDEMESIYNIATGSLLDIVSTVDYPTMSYDREQAQKIWDRKVVEADLRSDIKKRLRENQDAMLDFYFAYLKVSTRHLKEWHKLCAARDRSYLAVYEGDWPEAIKNAAEAIKISPNEREAHILLAMSLLERNHETDNATATALVSDFLKRHQGQEAPGHLLKGVINLKAKRYKEATLDFDQAAAYYPKQQERLLDRLNLYRRRNFLNKSREGRIIVNQYRAMMTGSGYFSPDFQKARMFLEQGEKKKAKKKIFEHFFRRRLQGQWDRVLHDFQFCHRFLETDLFSIDRGDKVNLEIDSAMFTNSVIVTVNNGSSSDIHNMTILLCVRFTDMFPGDYMSFPVGETQAVLKAGESVNVGRKNISDITKDRLGTVKEFKDIIEYAAVLISDEVITWVEPREVEKAAKGPAPKEDGKTVKDEIKQQTEEVIDILVKEALQAIKDYHKGQQDPKPTPSPQPDK